MLVGIFYRKLFLMCDHNFLTASFRILNDGHKINTLTQILHRSLIVVEGI